MAAWPPTKHEKFPPTHALPLGEGGGGKAIFYIIRDFRVFSEIS